MKTIITVLAFLFSMSLLSQKPVNSAKPNQAKPAATKTVIANYNSAYETGDWAGYNFTDDKNAQIIFLRNGVSQKPIDEFWSKVSNGPTDMSEVYYTVETNVGKKYKIIYKIVSTKNKDLGGGPDFITKDNVIVSYEKL